MTGVIAAPIASHRGGEPIFAAAISECGVGGAAGASHKPVAMRMAIAPILSIIRRLWVLLPERTPTQLINVTDRSAGKRGIRAAIEADVSARRSLAPGVACSTRRWIQRPDVPPL